MVAANDSQFCANCHKEDFCVGCHDGRVRPRQVHPNDFLNMHAIAARQNSPTCTSCHHEQSFCLGCHQRSGVTMSGPLGNIAWHTFRQDAESVPGAMADYRTWAAAALDVLEGALSGRQYLLGGEFSGADIMMGYTLEYAKWFGLLSADHPNLVGYVTRLEARPAFQKALG